jgi:signal transduction histidine kinase
MLHKYFFDFIANNLKSSVLQSFHEIINSKNSLTFEAALLDKHNKEILFEITIKPLITDNKIAGIAGIGKNISGRKVIEGQLNELKNKLIEAERIISIEKSRSAKQKTILKELNQLKSEFITNISHELRTPLASIVGFSETISSDSDLSNELKSDFNKIILNEGKRLAKLINDILEVTHAEQGKIVLNKTEFDGNLLLKDVIEEKKKKIRDKSLNIILELPLNPVFIEADKERIAKIYSILLDTLIKTSKENGRIKIIVQDLIEELEVIISDTGAGLPTLEQSYSFEKISELNKSSSSVLNQEFGLIFVKYVADLHNGYFAIQSEKEKGTSFLLKLPKNIKNNRG